MYGDEYGSTHGDAYGDACRDVYGDRNLAVEVLLCACVAAMSAGASSAVTRAGRNAMPATWMRKWFRAVSARLSITSATRV